MRPTVFLEPIQTAYGFDELARIEGGFIPVASAALANRIYIQCMYITISAVQPSSKCNKVLTIIIPVHHSLHIGLVW